MIRSGSVPAAREGGHLMIVFRFVSVVRVFLCLVVRPEGCLLCRRWRKEGARNVKR